MEKNINSAQKKVIYVAQFASITLIWIFVIGVAVWIVNLLVLSLELNDAPGASIGISIIAIPVFITLASILTFVFVGFHKEEKRLSKTSVEK